MEIRQLRYFISAATYLNFTRAAKECFIVQTAMTQQIANLESELGVRLFERRHRALELTPAGERFLQDAKEIVAHAQAAQERVQSFEAGYDTLLRVGYHGEMFKQELIDLLTSLRQEGDRSKIILYQQPQNEMLEGLRNGELDFAFTLYGGFFEAEDWLEWTELGESCLKLAVAAHHPLAGRDKVTLGDIAKVPLINFDEKNHEERDILLAKEGVRIQEYCRVRDHTSGEILVRSGYGAAVWVSRLCRPELYPDLIFLEIQDHPGRERAVLAWKKDTLTPAKDRFRAKAEERLRPKTDC